MISNGTQTLQLITNKTNYGFYHELKSSFQTCKSFLFSVAFINSSALGLFTDELRNRKGKIITTNYMYGTDPNALEFLLKLDNIETRLFDVNMNKIGFHTKGYIFEMEDHYKIYVGSSNLTQSALKTNKEWNLLIVEKEQILLESIIDEFNNLWNESVALSESILLKYKVDYYKNNDFKQTNLYEKIISFLQQTEGYNFINDLSSYIEIPEQELAEKIRLELQNELKPNQMQEDACENLRQFREQGENKALVISATGTGKTYMAAFDVSQFNASKLLFIVHRETILRDALQTFKTILPNKKMGILTANSKDLSSDYIFASNIVISKDEYLYKFAKDYFDYIVIDEAHRSAASTYQKILSYFTPKFLLGMTATPERTDKYSIYDYFDHNVAVEYRLRESLEKKLVVPFQYYGIEDISTDIKNIDLNQKDELAKALSINKRVDLIINEMIKYPYNGKKRKALGFCVSVEHANYMANEFNLRNLKSISLSGIDNEYQREYAMKRLSDDLDELSYIFTVDIFNEGIDIPSINTILMLRPTDSPIIFTQQLGRGLRKYQYKEFLVVLDFIANHNKNFLLPIALYGDATLDKDDLIESTKSNFWDIPGDVFVTLNEISKERILKQLEETNFNESKYLKGAYIEMFNRYKQIGEVNKNNIYLPIDQISIDEFDAVRFIKKAKTYVQFVQSIHKDERFSELLKNQDSLYLIKTLENLLPIVNPYIFVVAKFVLLNNSIDIDAIIKESSKYQTTSKEDIEYAINYLSGKYYDKTNNKLSTLLEQHDKEWKLNNATFDLISNNKNLFMLLMQSINYGLNRYNYEFSSKQIHDGFLLYRPYSYYDVALVINYKKTISAFSRQGILSKENNYYLFVNLNKHEVRESIDYKDEFINNHTFQWESQNNTGRESPVAKNIRNHRELGYKIHLFVRKNKEEDNMVQGFYYFGLLNYVSDKNEKPIRFIFNLENIIPENILNKFKTVHKVKNEKNN